MPNNRTEKLIHNQVFKEFLKSNCNLLRISINGLEEIIEDLYDEMENTGETASNPDSEIPL